MKTEPASPEQVLLFGAIAARLRAYLEEQDLTPSQFREQLGMNPNNPVVYTWLNAKGAPSAKHRAAISGVTGIAEKYLMPADEAPQQEIAVEKRTYTRTAGTDPLSFVIGADGQATIKLNLTLPVEQALPLLRLITDYPAIKQ